MLTNIFSTRLFLHARFFDWVWKSSRYFQGYVHKRGELTENSRPQPSWLLQLTAVKPRIQSAPSNKRWLRGAQKHSPRLSIFSSRQSPPHAASSPSGRPLTTEQREICLQNTKQRQLHISTASPIGQNCPVRDRWTAATVTSRSAWDPPPHLSCWTFIIIYDALKDHFLLKIWFSVLLTHNKELNALIRV